jgi:hypothetical protein
MKKSWGHSRWPLPTIDLQASTIKEFRLTPRRFAVRSSCLSNCSGRWTLVLGTDQTYQNLPGQQAAAALSKQPPAAALWRPTRVRIHEPEDRSFYT